MTQKIAIFWFRRDLRLDDNRGLAEALKSGFKVLPVFIFDRNILDKLEDRKDARVDFIHRNLLKIKQILEAKGNSILIKYGNPQTIWPEILSDFNIAAVYTNHDYEPYAKERDGQIQKMLSEKGIAFHTFKDQVIFEKEEILTGEGKPYTVFTPFSRKWKDSIKPEHLQATDNQADNSKFLQTTPLPFSSLEEMNFQPSGIQFPEPITTEKLISEYTQNRDFPAIAGTSRLSVHLRFGTVSIRKMVSLGMKLNETWLNELIWREFYMMILWNFPHVAEHPFKEKYNHISWRNNEADYKAWCEGRTGYPLVDAGMRELNQTGFMHNRVRMVVASFLTKHLLIDWRWGEAYFAQKLLDFELASNNGGWQWAAGTGCDAAPYFRIFNPESQMQKFDAKGKYVLKWVPEFGTPAYPRPIVEHKFARERCLNAYNLALKSV